MNIKYTVSISILALAALLSVWMSRPTAAVPSAEQAAVAASSAVDRVDCEWWRRIESDPDAYSFACKVIDVADELLSGRNYDGAPDQGGPPYPAGSSIRRITYLALAYRLTGDARYFRGILECHATVRLAAQSESQSR